MQTVWLHVDNRVTRRKYFHCAVDAEGTVIFSSQRFSDIWQFVTGLEDHQIILVDGEEQWRIAVDGPQQLQD